MSQFIAQHLDSVRGAGEHEVSSAIWQTARFDPIEHRSYGWIGRALDGLPLAGQPNASSLLVGNESVPIAIRGRKSVAAALANMDDMLVKPRAAHPSIATTVPRGTSSNPSALLQRGTLDALGTADQLQRAAIQRSDATPPPESELGTRLAVISRLIRSDFGSRVYYAVQTGYDTHAYQRETHDLLLRNLSRALKYFLDDLKRAKFDDRVLVMTFNESGYARTVAAYACVRCARGKTVAAQPLLTCSEIRSV